MTGVHCSKASSDMSCKMADLDKAAGKEWEMEMDRKPWENRERETNENDSMDQKLVNKDQIKNMH